MRAPIRLHAVSGVRHSRHAWPTGAL